MGPGLFLFWPKSCGRNFLLACPGLSLYNIHQNFGKEIFMNTRTMLILYFIVMNLPDRPFCYGHRQDTCYGAPIPYSGIRAPYYCCFGRIHRMYCRYDRFPAQEAQSEVSDRASSDPDPADRSGARSLYQYIQDRIPVTGVVVYPLFARHL